MKRKRLLQNLHKIMKVGVAEEKRKQGEKKEKEKESAFENSRVGICSSAYRRAICEQRMEKVISFGVSIRTTVGSHVRMQYED